MNLDTPLASHEVTLERLDPLSAAAARPVTTGAAILALMLPIVAVLTQTQIQTQTQALTQPAWLLVSYFALVGAVWLLLDHSRVSRPLWQPPSAQLFQLLLVIMAITSVAATFGANNQLSDDWAPVVIGIMFLACTPYRPARELVFWTIVHTLLCALLGLAQAAQTVNAEVPTLTLAVTGSLTVALMGFAAAAYARSLTSSVQLWHDRAWKAAAAAALDHRGGVARSVQQRRISVLNREVVPYLSRIVDSDKVNDDDREEARRLARSIRTLLVAEVERTWAQLMLDDLVGHYPRLAITARTDDPGDLGRHATLERRTLLRALAAISVDRLAATDLELRLSAPDGRLVVRWSVATPRPQADARRALRPMLELIRGVTLRSSLHERPGRLVVEFEYGY